MHGYGWRHRCPKNIMLILYQKQSSFSLLLSMFGKISFELRPSTVPQNFWTCIHLKRVILRIKKYSIAKHMILRVLYSHTSTKTSKYVGSKEISTWFLRGKSKFANFMWDSFWSALSAMLVLKGNHWAILRSKPLIKLWMLHMLKISAFRVMRSSTTSYQAKSLRLLCVFLRGEIWGVLGSLWLIHVFYYWNHLQCAYCFVFLKQTGFQEKHYYVKTT